MKFPLQTDLNWNCLQKNERVYNAHVQADDSVLNSHQIRI